MPWAQMARASRAGVVGERAWPPNFCYWIVDSALEKCLATDCPVGQWWDMKKGKQVREGLTGACSWYAIGDRKVPHSAWMVFQPEVTMSQAGSAPAIECPTRITRLTFKASNKAKTSATRDSTSYPLSGLSDSPNPLRVIASTWKWFVNRGAMPSKM